MFFRPNLLILPEAVYDAIEYRPRLLDKLGDANLIKKVDEANLAKLFRIDKVVIAKGRADFSKRNAGKTLTLSGIWENSVVLSYTSETWDEPCAGKVLMVKYPQADNTGYVGRTWDDVTELVAAKDLVYSIKDML